MLLYIDPGTGSMLFSILIGVIGAGFYSLRMLWIKLRFMISGGKVKENSEKLPFVIFSDDKRYWTIFEPICREMDRRGRDIVYMTASQDDPALKNPYPHVKAEFIGKDNKAFARLNFLNAAIVLSTTPSLDVYQWKRSKSVQYYVHIPHAASDITLYRMFGIDYYDAILLSGDHQARDIRNLEKLRGLPEKELIQIGIPYMDEMAARLERSEAVPEHPLTVLLAPSWGPSAIFSVYGSRILDVLMKTGYHIIVRPHPQSFVSEKILLEKLMKKYPASDQLEWNQDTDNFEVLRRSDILISDFSGVIFDFTLIFDKPVIYTDPQFDVGPYDAWWLKTPLWTSSALPRLGCQLTEDNMEYLREVIDSCLTDPQYAEGRHSVKEETWAHVGEGAIRTADYLLDLYEKLMSTDKARSSDDQDERKN
ncbi:MAG: CDP-glycerol glycerophosphotransferase family protein [Acetatifactor sp.]|nr:CDP-glycerol glycerophosphotransferase family protein [Acetatifactor sp.]